MLYLPNPLDQQFREYHSPPVKILSDRGIMQAIDLGLMTLTPKLDLSNGDKRLQPATLDVRMREVEGSEPIRFLRGHFEGAYFVTNSGTRTFPGKTVSAAILADHLDFGQYEPLPQLRARFIRVSLEARSSLRRFGCFMTDPRMFASLHEGNMVDISNFSPNDIHFPPEERVAQILFLVDPFADFSYTSMHDRDHVPKPLDIGEKVRSLDMGVEVTEYNELWSLERKGYLEVAPVLQSKDGAILVHAGDTAYRMKTVPGGIDFSRRDEYLKDTLLEPIDIRKGYTVQPYEHIIIETVERFYLSPHVGIRFWDNVLGYLAEAAEKSKDPEAKMRENCSNIELINLTDGWIDPGYEGGFSRQPKWFTGRTIHPGDVVGIGQVFYFPNPVERAYGKSELGSQYQKKGQTELGK